jgi:hypothetical protein
MNGLTYEATVVNGLIRLPEDVHLPENSTVLVFVPSKTPESLGRIPTPRLADPSQAVDFRLTVQEIPDAGL